MWGPLTFRTSGAYLYVRMPLDTYELIQAKTQK